MNEMDSKNFELVVLRHLDSAYNLARWLLRDGQDAEDVVQEACLRAYKYFGGYHGGDARAWMLQIVRRACMDWLRKKRTHEPVEGLDELPSTDADPQEVVLDNLHLDILRDALAELPVEFREVTVLRELEQLSYKEIADITEVPIGTVMSRLARARKRLVQMLAAPMGRESAGGV